MSDHVSPNNHFLDSHIEVSKSSELKDLAINLSLSIRFPKDSHQMSPALEQSVFSSLDQKAVRYYSDYLNQFLKNKRLNQQLTEVIQDRNLLADKYNSIKTTKTTQDSVHRKRRFAKDIQRLFYCPIEKCKKGYGSEGSLSHHVRLKHLEFHQSGKYEIFIQRYLDKMKESQKKPQENKSLNNQMVNQICQSLQKGESQFKRSNVRQNKKSSVDQK